MDILGLTTTEAVRAFIGIDEDSRELPDQLFVDLEIEDGLKLEFGAWLPVTLAALLAGGDNSGSPADLAYTAARQAARAWCAMEVLQVAEISIATKHSDGQNEFVRQPYKVAELLERLKASYLRYRDMVLVNLNQTTTPSTSWLAGYASPAYDPVTNTTV
jgi:hypothetical protein